LLDARLRESIVLSDSPGQSHETTMQSDDDPADSGRLSAFIKTGRSSTFCHFSINLSKTGNDNGHKSSRSAFNRPGRFVGIEYVGI